MTDRHEFHAATVEEALDRAAGALGAGPGNLEFEVLDEGSSGFLGIGARDARIAVWGAAPPSDRDDEEAPAVEERGEDLLGSEEGASSATVRGTRDDVEAQEAPEDLLLDIDRFATELIDAMGFEGTVDAYDTDECIRVDVRTEQTGLFIGQKGETIDAVQHLVNVAVYKHCPFVKRIVVDTEGYRRRRVEAIQGMAHRTARRAQREKRPLSLPPMSASERRVVHLFLKENPRVSTSSEGQDEDRRVVISPV